MVRSETSQYKRSYYRIYRETHREQTRAAWKKSHIKTRDARREWIKSLKSQPCADCGNTFPSCAMDFDHVRGAKVGLVGRMAINRPLALVEKEVAKCDVVCANCHRVRTQLRRLAARQEQLKKSAEDVA